jgi:hypothetical protein
MGNLNQNVVDFATKNLGKRVYATGKKLDTDKEETTVGAGGCWDLPFEALKTAGAKIPDRFKEGESTSNWGQKIPMSSAKPGDIIQFSNHLVTIEVITIVNGISQGGTGRKSKRGPVHSGIVSQVNSDGTMYIFEQHVNGKNSVQQNLVYFKGSVKEETEGISTTRTTVKVTGSFQIYRPQ